MAKYDDYWITEGVASNVLLLAVDREKCQLSQTGKPPKFPSLRGKLLLSIRTHHESKKLHGFNLKNITILPIHTFYKLWGLSTAKGLVKYS